VATFERTRRGYTLIELLLVMVALGLLATVVYVTWEAILPRTKLNTAVRELAATLQETRSDAVSRGVAFTVEYAFEENEDHPRGYRVVTPFRAGGQGGLAADDEDRLALAWKRLPENIEFQSITIDGQLILKGLAIVRFDPRGSASDHNIVLVQKPYGNTYTVEVQALTGFIHMQAGEFVRQPPKDGDFE
jgi:prepilin-type N-terminal cleavage/methylation domain-containing protein